MVTLKTQIISCSNCKGAGCAQCKNTGLLLKTNKGIYFIWGPSREDSYIRFQKLVLVLNNFLDYLAILFGAAALIYQSVIFIWEQEFFISPLLWWGILALTFVFFRLSRRKETQKKLDLSQAPSLEAQSANISTLLQSKNILDAHDFLNRAARLVLIKSWGQAENTLEPFFVFKNTLSDKKTEELILRLGLNPNDLKKRWRKQLRHFKREEGSGFNLVFKELLLQALVFALLSGRETISPVELFLASVKVEPKLLALFQDQNLDLKALSNTAQWIYNRKAFSKSWKRFATRARFKPKGVMNRAYTSRATPILDRVSDDLTVQARAGALPLLVNRAREIKEIVTNLRQADGNVILTGKPGVGKSAIVYGLANLMAEEKVPEILQDKRLISLDLASLFSVPGESERPIVILKKVISEVVKSGNIILFIDNISNLIGLGQGGSGLDAAEIIMRVLPKPTVHAIGIAIEEDYHQVLEGRGDFLRRFQVIKVAEPDADSTLEILESSSSLIEYQESVFFTYPALNQAIVLSQKYIYDSYLPAKALNLLADAASFARSKGKLKIVYGDDIVRLVEERIKVPISKVTKEEGEKLLHLEDEMHKRIIDQEEGVSMVAEALRRARADMREGKRPIASLLFAGPTGVGKTETAKTLAAIYFGSETRMIRLDMSEYQAPDSINKLIGAAPGQGSAGRGYLTEAVRRNPFALVLLDELEKAHPNILNAFLQVVEDGRLTDGRGRTIDFTNTIIIATTNAGTVEITKAVKEGIKLAKIKKDFIENILTQNYRLEFLNRFDGIVLFRPLAPEHVVAIAGLMLEKVRKRLLSKNMHFSYTKEAAEDLAEKGFDPVFGARPLRRLIQDTVDNSLAKYILSGELGPRDVAVLEKGGGITIKQAEEI